MPDVATCRRLLEEALPGVKLFQEAGRGGQGRVFVALHPRHELVAIKVLAQGPLSTDDDHLRFDREINILSRMDNEHLVPILEHGVIGEESERVPYFIMPLIDGATIDDYCHIMNEPTTRQCVELFLQICAGLCHAHAKGVIHRDLKPGNIIVGDKGHVSILDFGMGSASNSVAITMPASIVGTPAWTAPEQLKGALPDVRMDVHGLGMIMFNMLSRQLPYDVEGGPKVAHHNILTAEPRRLLTMQPSVDRGLAAVIDKCLREEPDERYQSMADLRDDLQHWQRGEAVAARSSDRFYRWKKALRRYKWAVATVLAITGMGCFSTFMWQNNSRLAATYGAGLEIYDRVQRGSEARDEGRTAEALALWHEALELDSGAPLRNAAIDRMRYETLHRLCEFHLVDKDPDTARQYCADAVATAAQYAEHPDIGWQRRAGFAEILRGRVALADKDPGAALAAFANAVDIRREFVKQDPESVSHEVDLARALSLSGRACRKLERMDESLSYYTEAYDIRLALLEADPGSAERSIDLVQAEAKLALWNLKVDRTEALRWLDSSEQRLTRLRGDGGCDDRPRDCRILRRVLTDYRGRLMN